MTTQTITNPMRLRDLAESVAYAASRDSTRYALNAIHFETDSDGLLAVATGGYRLAIAHSRENGIDLPKGGFSIELAGIKALKKTLHRKGVAPSTAEFAVTSRTAELVCQGRSSASIPLVTGKYPNWRQVVPRADPTSQLELPPDTSSLIEALDDFAGIGTVVIAVSGRSLVFSAEKALDGGGITGSVRVEFDIAPKVPGTKVGVNGRYLADALRQLSGVVKLQLPAGGLTPIRLDDPNGNIAVVMPVRT